MEVRTSLPVDTDQPQPRSVPRKIGTLIKERDHGRYIVAHAAHWYVFEVKQGRLQWCRSFISEHEANAFFFEHGVPETLSTGIAT